MSNGQKAQNAAAEAGNEQAPAGDAAGQAAADEIVARARQAPVEHAGLPSMVKPADGTTVHEISPRQVRVECVKAALEMRHAQTGTPQVIANAKALEQYVMGDQDGDGEPASGPGAGKEA